MQSSTSDHGKLSIRSIADDMGVTYNTARAWVLNEMVHYRTSSGTYRVDDAEYQRWKAAQRVDPRKTSDGAAA